MSDKAKHTSNSLLDGNQKIRWNPSFNVEEIAEEGVFLFSEEKNLFLEGDTYLLLSPLLQKAEYTADELASILQPNASNEDVFYALYRLEQKNLIQANINGLPDILTAFISSFDISLEEAYNRLRAAKIYVYFLDDKSDPHFISALESFNLEMTSTLNEASLSVIVVKDYLQQEITYFNEESLQNHRPLMLIRPFGTTLWIGPIFEPKKTGCWQCLTQRLRINRLEEDYVEKRKGLGNFLPPFHVTLPPTMQLGFNLAALEVFKRIILGKSEQLEGKLLTFNTLTLKQQEHILTKLPQCPGCGSAKAGQSKKETPLLLTSQKKQRNHIGGFRSVSAEKTLERFSHLISPLIGVVKYLESAKNISSSVIHVYEGGNNDALPKNVGRFKTNSFRSACSGKGTSEIDAKVGCLCETVERFSCNYEEDEFRITGSYLQLQSHAIDPREVLLYSEQQYEDREKMNPLNSGFNQISSPFPENAEIEWTPIWSLTEKRYKYYPSNCCFFRYPLENSAWDALADSNGCAAGNSIEEAILQGFFELVERDAVAIWWYNRLKRPALDLQSFNDPYIDKLLIEYEKIGRECWVLDITTDLKIPTVAALSRLKTGESEKILMGFGTHLDIHTATIRALTEMNQFLATSVFWEAPQRKVDPHIKEVREWLYHATIENQPYLQGYQKISAHDFPKWETFDILEDIQHCQHTVESLGMELLVLDYTKEEIELPVVRVLVPGLRHFWRRLGAGRIYDVPVKMGWMQEPLKESEMNPISIFI